MILTRVFNHNFELNQELTAARSVAEFAIANRNKLSSKHVKHIGLKSSISNQILRKYGRNKKCKEIKNVNLIVPGQGLKVDSERMILKIVPLKLKFDISYISEFTKINSVEISRDKIFICYSVCEVPQKHVDNYLGVDRDATGHIVIAADASKGLVLKMGKLANHFRRKYRGTKKDSRFMKDLNHKISRGLVNYANLNNCGIALENLKGIRPKKSKGKKLNGILHSWSFYQLQTFIEYKAKILGVPIVYVNPAYTSKKCSRCGNFGDRNKKHFKCSCGHVDHSGANAAFNIGHLAVDRDIVKRATDSPSA